MKQVIWKPLLQALLLHEVRHTALNFLYSSLNIIWLQFLYTEVGILLRGNLHGNNSVVTLTDIGEGSKSLLCITNKINCCQRMGTLEVQGNWYYPGNETTVPSNGTRGQSGFYRNRDLSRIRLHRRDEIISPTGLFRCTIPDSSDQDQTIFIGIYSTGNGKILVD